MIPHNSPCAPFFFSRPAGETYTVQHEPVGDLRQSPGARNSAKTSVRDLGLRANPERVRGPHLL